MRARSGVLLGLMAVALSLGIGACGGDDAEEGTGAAGNLELVTEGALSFGTDYTFPPFEYVENGENVGLTPELAAMLAEELGVELELREIGFQSLIPSLASRKFDVIMSTLFITEERAQQVAFVPYMTLGNVLVAPSNGEFQPQKPTDLCGHTVAAQQGGFIEALVLPDGDLANQCGADAPTVQSFPTAIQAYEEVARGRADATMDAEPVARFLLDEESGLSELAVTSPEGRIFFPVAVGMAIRRDADGLRAALEDAIEQLTENGRLPDLLDAYDASPVDEKLVQEALGE